jgi:hypothetical protein
VLHAAGKADLLINIALHLHDPAGCSPDFGRSIIWIAYEQALRADFRLRIAFAV